MSLVKAYRAHAIEPVVSGGTDLSGKTLWQTLSSGLLNINAASAYRRTGVSFDTTKEPDGALFELVVVCEAVSTTGDVNFVLKDCFNSEALYAGGAAFDQDITSTSTCTLFRLAWTPPAGEVCCAVYVQRVDAVNHTMYDCHIRCYLP